MEEYNCPVYVLHCWRTNHFKHPIWQQFPDLAQLRELSLVILNNLYTCGYVTFTLRSTQQRRSIDMRVRSVKQARRRSGIDRRGASGSGSGREQQDIVRLAADAIWPVGCRRMHTQERACRGTVARNTLTRGH